MHLSPKATPSTPLWKHGVAVALAFSLVSLGLVLTPRVASATACPVTTVNGNCSSSETETLTVTGGTLDITVPASVALPSTPVGQNSTPTNVGTVTWTDTLGGTTPSITAATTDLCQSQVGAPTCSTSNDISASNIYLSMTGSSITAQDDGTCVHTNNAGGSWTNGTGTSAWSIATDTTPGSTLSSTFTLASASTGTDGCYGYASAASPNLSVHVPASAAVQPYTGTLTYTITD